MIEGRGRLLSEMQSTPQLQRGVAWARLPEGGPERVEQYLPLQDSGSVELDENRPRPIYSPSQHINNRDVLVAIGEIKYSVASITPPHTNFLEAPCL